MEQVEETFTMNSLVVRQRRPAGEGLYPLVLLLHGWTGDENAMWVFNARLPQNVVYLAPRGIYTTPSGGYGWQKGDPARTWVDEYSPAIEQILALLDGLPTPYADISKVGVVGFSQGAALAYALALLYPQRMALLAGLAGFLPEGSEALARNRPLLGKPVFIAHGSNDTLVPVEAGRHSADILELAGAKVTYCEDDVGHKLSALCYNGLAKFFRVNIF